MKQPKRRWRPWSAALIPLAYRDDIVGDALEETATLADSKWRRALCLHRILLIAAAAAWRQDLVERWRLLVRSVRLFSRPSARSSTRIVHRRPTMSAFFSDLRYAFRSLVRAPAFVLVAVLTLALGTGGVTAMYSLLHGTMLRPLDWDRADRLVVLQTIQVEESIPVLSKPDLEDVRAASTRLVDLAVWRPWRVTVDSADGTPTRVWAASVDSRYFPLLGVDPALGRAFSPSDDRPGHDPVVMLSYTYWQSVHGGDSSIVGSSLDLDGTLHTVVGVTPPGFADPMGASFASTRPLLWRASPPEFHNDNRSWRSFWTLGLLAEGADIAALETELATIGSRLEADWPSTNAEVRLAAVGLRELLVGANRATILILTAAVLLVLLAACANVAILLLSRGASRSHEHALRRALGGGRLRILRPLALEHGLLAIAGLLTGFGLARLVGWLAAPWTGTLTALLELRLDAPVLFGAGAVSLVVAVLFGLIPAWQSSSPPAQKIRGAQGVGLPGGRTRSALVVVEATLAVTLLVGAGLLLRSFNRLNQVDLGIEVDGVVVATVTPSVSGHATPEAVDAVIEQVLAGLARAPGIARAGVVSDLPLTGAVNTGWLTRPDRPLPSGTAPPSALYRTVAGAYFEALGMRVLSGRQFDRRDHADAPPVAILNQAAAELLFSDEAPLGQVVEIMGSSRQVLGVVNSVREGGAAVPAAPAVFVPFAQERQEWATRTTTLVASVDSADPETMLATVRAVVLAVDPTIAVNDLRTMDDVAARALRPVRFRTAVLAAFALVALLFATVGLGGVALFQVAYRRRELGLRMALGASRSGVVALLVRRVARLSAVGAAAGALMAALAARWLGHLLFEIGPLDPVVFLGVPAFFVVIAVVAASLPASLAARLHPAVTLREE